MKKYIFLDIDGVIATPASIIDGLWGLVDKKQELLGIILEDPDVELIISSSWRLHTIQDTISHFDKEGFLFCDRITGITIRAYHYIKKGIHFSIPRGVEIKQWIDTNVRSDNGKDWNRKILGEDYSYVIIDDASDMLLEHKDNFVHYR